MDMEYLSRAKVQETEREIVRVQLAAEAQSPTRDGGLVSGDRVRILDAPSRVTQTAFGCAWPRLCRKSDLPAKTPATVIPVIVCLGRRR